VRLVAATSAVSEQGSFGPHQITLACDPSPKCACFRTFITPIAYMGYFGRLDFLAGAVHSLRLSCVSRGSDGSLRCMTARRASGQRQHTLPVTRLTVVSCRCQHFALQPEAHQYVLSTWSAHSSPRYGRSSADLLQCSTRIGKLERALIDRFALSFLLHLLHIKVCACP
jgi:hypothetical protein